MRKDFETFRCNDVADVEAQKQNSVCLLKVRRNAAEQHYRRSAWRGPTSMGSRHSQGSVYKPDFARYVETLFFTWDCRLTNIFQTSCVGTPLKCIADVEVPHGGDSSTVNVGHISFGTEDLVQEEGPSYRHIIALDEVQYVTPKPIGTKPSKDGTTHDSRFLGPLGQSGTLNRKSTNFKPCR